MLRKMMVVFIIAMVLAGGSGWYLWEKNKSIVTELENMEKSLFIDNQSTSPGTESPPAKVTQKSSNGVAESEKTEKPEEPGKSTEIERPPKQVSVSDRAQVVALVTRRLSAADIKRLKKLAQGGVTPEEKREAKAIVLSKFSREEVDRIRELYRKYK